MNAKYRVEVYEKIGTVIYHPKTEHKFTLIWMHGLGDSAYGARDMFLLDKYIILPEGCKIIMPTAPSRKVGIMNDEESQAWYDIKFKEG
jgi:phospholipase/carboxylesterase